MGVARGDESIGTGTCCLLLLKRVTIYQGVHLVTPEYNIKSIIFKLCSFCTSMVTPPFYPSMDTSPLIRHFTRATTLETCCFLPGGRSSIQMGFAFSHG